MARAETLPVGLVAILTVLDDVLLAETYMQSAVVIHRLTPH